MSGSAAGRRPAPEAPWSALPADDKLGPGGHDRLARLGDQLRAGGQDVVAAAGGDVLDHAHALETISGVHRAGVPEPLLAVDHPGVVDADVRNDHVQARMQRDDHRKGRRRDHVAMTERARRLRVTVQGVLAAARAELLQLNAVRVVAAVLARDVVALLALHARHCDLGTDISRLGHGGAPSSSSFALLQTASSVARPDRQTQSGALRLPGSGGRTRTGDTAIMSRLLCHLSYTAESGRSAVCRPRRKPRPSEPPYGIEP